MHDHWTGGQGRRRAARPMRTDTEGHLSLAGFLFATVLSAVLWALLYAGWVWVGI